MRFDRVYYLGYREENEDRYVTEVVAINKLKWGIQVYKATSFGTLDREAFFVGVWDEPLPGNANDVMNMFDEHDTDGWSVSGSCTEIMADMCDVDCDVYLALCEMMSDLDEDMEVSYDTDVTEMFNSKYDESEGNEMNEMMRRIQELSNEIDRAIENTKAEAKAINDKRNKEYEAKWKCFADFMKERSEVIRPILKDSNHSYVEFPLARELRVGFEITGNMYMAYYGNKAEFNNRICHHENTADRVAWGSAYGNHYDYMEMRNRFKDFLNDWNVIEANVFDNEFYKTCTILMKEKLEKANEELEKARNGRG